MSNQEIFLTPGHFLLQFVLSLVGLDLHDISDDVEVIGTLILTLGFWWYAGVALLALIKKKFGFHGGQRR